MNYGKLNLRLGDCMDLMRDTPDGFYDIIYADPPYGIDFQSSRMIERKRKKKIANDKSPFIKWIPEAYRVLKSGGCMVLWYRWDVQDVFMEAIKYAKFKIRGQIVWDKVSHGMGDLNGGYAPQHELAFFATKGKYSFPNNRPNSVYRCLRISGQKLIHPNEKTPALSRMILRDIGKSGQNVLIPFMGSGNEVVSAQGLGMNVYSTEIDPDYYRDGMKRVREQTAQGDLFKQPLMKKPAPEPPKLFHLE